MSPLLRDKVAIVYGAGGPVGTAVARSFASEGARVFLAGRREEPLRTLAADIGGNAAPVDATDRAAVEAHADAVVSAEGRIDVVFNAVANDDLQGRPLLDLDRDDFLRPVVKAVTTQFTVATAAARRMTHGGVILAMGGGREAIADLGGSHVAWAALAGLCRQLAAELGPRGIRVLWVLSSGSPDPEAQGPDSPAEDGGPTLLGRRPSYAQVGELAAFLASDRAGTMTATEVNITAGAVVD
jgi:3-oxoacyl-[acyl-carrier protein] reductase